MKYCSSLLQYLLIAKSITAQTICLYVSHFALKLPFVLIYEP